MIGRMFLTGLALLFFCVPVAAKAAFRFEDQVSLSDMQSVVRQTIPVGSSREQVRAIFLQQGGATLKAHPTQPGVEKYLYDINLCSYYVWRWNISADYDPSGKLKQLYVNGEPALPDGAAARVFPKTLSGRNSAILKRLRPRPEAYKGESTISAFVLDLDANPATIDDEDLIGAGPTRADPLNMGTLHAYHVEPWRSIFDLDDAKAVVPYSGDCSAADAAAAAGSHRSGIGN